MAGAIVSMGLVQTIIAVIVVLGCLYAFLENCCKSKGNIIYRRTKKKR